MKVAWQNKIKYLIRIRPVDLKKGIGLIEIVFATSIIAVVFVGVFSALNFYIKVGFSNVEKIEAIYLAEEGLEAVRHLRDGSWSSNISSLSMNTPYYLSFEPTLVLWQATTSEILIGDLKRYIILSDVYRRDSDSDIISSTSPEAKTLDLNTKGFTIFVYKTFSGGEREIISIDMYISNIFNN